MTEQRPSPDSALGTALADVAEAFSHRRATRRRGRERTPPSSRRRAAALLEHHRPSHVARALGLNPATLARRAARADSDTAAVRDTPPDAFAPLPDDTAAAVSINTAALEAPREEAELIVRWPHGAQLVARGPVPAATLAAILAAAASAAPGGSCLLSRAPPPVLLGVAPADFRCGIDGFAARCRTLLGHEPVRGTLQVFINRRATMIRVRVRDGTGFWLRPGRLSKGRFGAWPRGGEGELSVASARALRAWLTSGSLAGRARRCTAR